MSRKWEVKIRRKLEEIRVVLINSNFSEIRSSEFADDNIGKHDIVAQLQYRGCQQSRWYTSYTWFRHVYAHLCQVGRILDDV